jgi:hypothetical protein
MKNWWDGEIQFHVCKMKSGGSPSNGEWGFSPPGDKLGICRRVAKHPLFSSRSCSDHASITSRTLRMRDETGGNERLTRIKPTPTSVLRKSVPAIRPLTLQALSTPEVT